MKKTKKGMSEKYLHGFDKTEQARLRDQATFLEKSVHDRVPFGESKTVLEIGCGVGAQSEILLKNFPNIHLTGIDASQAQLSAAQKHLASRKEFKGRYELKKADALHLPFDDNQFEGVFICWLLEHVQTPIEILEESRRVLKEGGRIFCNEVMNATFYVHPYAPATQKFWFELNDYQWSMKGDPFVGGKLANYLLKAGFQDIKTRVLTHHYDHRTPKKRAKFIQYWSELLQSAAPNLLQDGRVTEHDVSQMQKEMEAMATDPEAVFFYSWVQAIARAW
jgi:ubiquinone/menaquinone biosynthesis C-methylase UbiE